MKAFHHVFHVSMLRKCLHEPEKVVVQILEDLLPNMTLAARPARILERRIKELRKKKIPLVRVLWDSAGTSEETLELEAKMKLHFQKWFEKQAEA